MERRIPGALAIAVALAFGPRSAAPQSVVDPSCHETPKVRAIPPPTQNAGTLGDGPWWTNDDRSIWMQSATGPWHVGYNQKNMMVKPSGVAPSITGKRIDAQAPPMTASFVPQWNYEFQTMGLTFPTDGCWKIGATAGGHSLEFITFVLNGK